jgi:hypothetical protein
MQAIEALGPPDEDAPLVALALSLAATLDGLEPALRPTMTAQTAGPLLRTLTALYERAEKRRGTVAPEQSGLARLRAARAASNQRAI